MQLYQQIEEARRGYLNAKPRSARRTEKHRQHVMLTVKLLRKKFRKAKRGRFSDASGVSA